MRVPLSRKLVGLDQPVIFRLRVIAEIPAVPELADVRLLRLREKSVIFTLSCIIAEHSCALFTRAKRRQPQTTRVGANALHYPRVIGLVGIAAVLRNPAAMVKLSQVLDCGLYRWPCFAQKASIRL